MEAADSFDLIVCGGGPAGTSAAITAVLQSPQMRVLLIEAGAFPRHKVCGEFFSPEAVAVLRGLLGPGQELLDQALRIERVGLHNRRVSASFALPQPALSLTRHDLDAALWARAMELGIATLERTRVLSISADGERFNVNCADAIFDARAVINATGRWSELNTASEGRTRMVGIKGHFSTPTQAPLSCDLHFFKGGYIGHQPISPTAVTASALVDASRFRDLDAIFSAAGMETLVRDWKPLFPAVTCPPVRFAPPAPVRDGALNCGDAAAFIDPFAGDGMSLALHSGGLAGEYAVQMLLSGARREGVASYDREYRKRFASAFRSAARLRRFAFGAEWTQSLCISALRVPFVARAALASTRAG